jgi:hypothetical protein
MYTKSNRISSIIFGLLVCLGAAGNQALAQQPISASSHLYNSAEAFADNEFSNFLMPVRPAHRSGVSLMPVGYRSSVGGAVFNITPLASGPNLPVLGGGTLGRLTKWTGLTSSNSFIGDTTIFEDKYGNVGIGTDTPTSKLTVAGMIEITLGGLRFPDGTVQTTAGLSSIFHDASLMGNGTSGSPLGIALGGVQTVHQAAG